MVKKMRSLRLQANGMIANRHERLGEWVEMCPTIMTTRWPRTTNEWAAHTDTTQTQANHTSWPKKNRPTTFHAVANTSSEAHVHLSLSGPPPSRASHLSFLRQGTCWDIQATDCETTNGETSVCKREHFMKQPSSKRRTRVDYWPTTPKAVLLAHVGHPTPHARAVHPPECSSPRRLTTTALSEKHKASCSVLFYSALLCYVLFCSNCCVLSVIAQIGRCA